MSEPRPEGTRPASGGGRPADAVSPPMPRGVGRGLEPIAPAAAGQPGASWPVELTIDELVLDGFAPGDRDRIGDAVQRELARLLAEGGLPAGLTLAGAIPSLDAGAFDVAPGDGPAAIGARIARALYQRIGR